jgi:hypothetical protein
MNFKIREIMMFYICALQEYSDVMSWAYLLASIFYLCAFVGLLHKFECSLMHGCGTFKFINVQ